MMKNILVVLFFVCSANVIFGQTTERVRPYSQVIRGVKTQRGLFAVHTSSGIRGNKLYFEIPDSLLGRDIMIVDRLAENGGGQDIYPGEEVGEETILFERGPGHSIRIRYDDELLNVADSSDAIYKAVARSSVKPIVESFPILAYGKDSSCVIDVTKFLLSKDGALVKDQLTKPGDLLSRPNIIGNFRNRYLEYVHAYPANVEIAISETGSVQFLLGQKRPFSAVIQMSFIELPRIPLQRRLFDPRVGFFTGDPYDVFGDQQQKAESRKYICRWRLEPREEDREKWKNGQLVEPAKPIVYYIDPATPKQWRKYLILGVNDWQKAFEHAGFKNAIIGKEWPENDSTMHIDDARYSFINYFPSMTENAYGPQVHDPRSGEIIQSHIGWYHNVMQVLHEWYMIQTGAVDPKARTPKLSEELMGQLIRFVSSHEVGHTLGLRHNFGSSSQTPVDSLRSRTWLEKHGHTASIMDYARFDYVAQPEDNIPQEDLFPHIGEYDCWAIGWGYKSSHSANEEEDRKIVGRWITDSLARNPRLWWEDGELRNRADPRLQTEDLGDDAAKASAYGIKNLQRILPNLPAWTHEEGGLYTGLNDMYGELKGQYVRYLNHVLKNVAGIYNTVRSEDVPGDVHAAVPKAKQREALEFFNQQLFTTPYWLVDQKLINKVDNVGYIPREQSRVLAELLKKEQLDQVLINSIRYGSQNVLTVNEYIAIIHQGIWKELEGKGPVIVKDPIRRDLQKAYVNRLLYFIASSKYTDEGGRDASETDAYSVMMVEILFLTKEIEKALARTTDVMTRSHLEDLKGRIKFGPNNF